LSLLVLGDAGQGVWLQALEFCTVKAIPKESINFCNMLFFVVNDTEFSVIVVNEVRIDASLGAIL
jgi:hypothetical protein